MSKEKKGNRESKKPKTTSASKKEKKDPKRYDSNISELFGNAKKAQETRKNQA